MSSTQSDAAICSGGLATLSLAEACAVYWLEILFLVTLFAITIFRRKLSCNHCYTEEEDDLAAIRGTDPRTNKAVQTNGVICWDYQQADLLLDGAGHYCSGAYSFQPYLFQILHFMLPTGAWKLICECLSSWWLIASEGQRLDEFLDGAENWCIVRPHPQPSPAVRNTLEDSTNKNKVPLFPAAPEVPNDSVVYILSYLHPKDILRFASVNRDTANTLCDNADETSVALWKALWFRDYAWVLDSWDVGREAAFRSFQSPSFSTDERKRSISEIPFSKDFYLRFGMCYVNYLLAGQCTEKSCLVGLGGNIYDLTKFLDKHPGSQETVLVHAGRDATAVFESMRHTVAARSLAQKLCVIVDKGIRGECGVCPTVNLNTDEPSFSFLPPAVGSETPPDRPFSASVATVEALHDDFLLEEEQSRRKSILLHAKLRSNVVGEVHTYFDPLCLKWKAWYIDSSFEVVFVEDF